MTATILRGNALALPLADACADLIVTSPPYFGLRSYTDGGEHYAGQIGSEATPGEFVDALIAATREMVRVLKPSGSIWVNLGDKYAQTTERSRNGYDDALSSGPVLPTPIYANRRDYGRVRVKSLMGMPWRYALHCIDELGLILRAEVIWSKPNGLPESVTDRVRRSHEQWFHMVREPRYYSAADEIRESYAETQRAGVLTWEQRRNRDDKAARYSNQNGHGGTAGMAQSPLGKLPGSVWEVPTQPLTVPAHLGVEHFAAFPMEWPRRIICGWSPPGICVDCGDGRRPVAAVHHERYRQAGSTGRPKSQDLTGTRSNGRNGVGYPQTRTIAQITGYICACSEPTAATRPAVVLDPFGGTGTTALVADALGRHGISVDMSADYCRLARWRTTDPGQRAAAMQVEKPPPPAQDDALFELGPKEATA